MEPDNPRIVHRGDDLNHRVMFFEIGSGGHRLEYVERLLLGLAEQRFLGSVVFVLTPDFKDRLDDSLLTDARKSNAVDLVYMTGSESRRCQSNSGLWRRINRSLVLDRYLRATESDLGFVNYLDPVLTGLTVPFPGRSRRAIAGILFRPTVHYPSPDGEPAGSRSLSRRIRHRLSSSAEHILYKRSFRNPRLTSVLSLDPFFPDYARRRYRGGDKVRRLPEPYSGGQSPELGERRAERITFVLIGSVTRRKGLLETLDALSQLTSDESSQIRLVVAGRIQDDLRAEAERRAEELLANRPELDIEIRDGFIPEDEFGTLIRDSHVILAPYRRHVGSSGILVWAAHHRRPVISQRFGLMGALVARYGLGLVCNPEDAMALAQCIRQAVLNGPQTLGDPAGMAEFAARNDNQSFLKSVFLAAGLQQDSIAG